MLKQKSLHRFIFLLFLSAVIIFGSLYILSIQTENIKTQIVASEKFYLTLLENSLIGDLKSVLNNVRLISSDITLETYLKNKTEQNYKNLCDEFLNYSNNERIFDQICFIDTKGDEIVRVNIVNNNGYVVNKQDLQNKRNRYYFKNTIDLKKGQLFISKFDLNVEHGKIEKPYKPMIRFCMPVFNSNGKKKGIVVINYLANNFTKEIVTKKHIDMLGSIFLLNKNGYFLKSELNKNDEFGFMFKDKQNMTFEKPYPQIWKVISKSKEGNIISDKGLFTYKTMSALNFKVHGIEPAIEKTKVPEWKLVSFVSNEKFNEQYIKYRNFIVGIDIFLFVLIIIGYFFYNRFHKEREKQIALLAESEEKFRKTFKISPDSININRLEDGLYVDINEGFTAIMGYTSADTIGKTSAEINIWVNSQDRERLVKGLRGSGRVTNLEAKFRKKDGSITHGLMSANIISINNEPHILSITRDFEEIYNAQKVIKDSELRYLSLFNSIRDSILVADVNRKIINCSIPFESQFGYKKEELLGKKTQYIYGNSEQFEKHWKKLKENIYDKLPSAHTANYKRKDGSVFPGETSISYLKDVNGNVSGYIWMIRDVTERKKAEKEIKFKEQELRLIYDSVRDSIYYLHVEQGSQYKFLSVNKAFLTATGLTKDQIVDKYIEHVIPEPSLRLVRNNYKQAIQEKKIVSWEETSQYPSGNRTGLVSIAPIFDEDGKCTHLIGSVHDISERKNAEELILTQRKRLADILKGTNAGTWDWNVQTGELILNERWAEIMGYTLKELEPIDIQTWIKNVHREDLPKANTLLEKHFSKKTDYYDVEFRQPHKNGGWIWVNARGKVFEWTEDGKPLRMSGTHIDITNRKKAELEILKLSQVVQQSRVSVVITDLESNIEYANPFFSEITGYSKEEAIGQNPRFISSGKYTKEFYKKMYDKISNGGIWRGEFHNKKKTGEFYWEEATITPLVDKEGKIINYCAIKNNITKRKEIEEEVRKYRENLEELVVERTAALQKSEETFRALADNSPDNIMRFDKEGRYVFANPNIGKNTGIDVKSVLGKTHFELGLPEDLATLLNSSIKEVFKTKKVNRIEFKLPNGTWFDLVLVPEFDKNKNVTAVIGSGRNITKLKELEIELNTALKIELELNELKTQFISTVSHEFRTPLTSIFSSIDLLDLFGDDWTEGKRKAQYNQVRSSVDRLTGMLDEVLKISRLERRKLSATYENVQIYPLFSSIVKEAEPLLTPKHKFVLSIKLEQKSFYLDKGIIRTVLLNLLSNAIKYSPEGGNVDINLKREEINLLLIVKDEGFGMSEDDLKDIFSEFYRTEAASHIQGTGLGLSIVKRLVETISGKIEVASKLGKGTTFTVTIPIKTKDANIKQTK